MNAYITYIESKTHNNLQSLDTSLLSSYILSKEEQEYIETLNSTTESEIKLLKLNAETKAGSSFYTQPALNKLYVRSDNSSYSVNDKKNLRSFLDKHLVGNEIVKFTDF